MMSTNAKKSLIGIFSENETLKLMKSVIPYRINIEEFATFRNHKTEHRYTYKIHKRF